MKTLDQKKFIDELETIYQFAKQYLEIKERPVVICIVSPDICLTKPLSIPVKPTSHKSVTFGQKLGSMSSGFQ